MKSFRGLAILLLSTKIYFVSAFTTSPRLYFPPLSNWATPQQRHHYESRSYIKRGLSYHDQTNGRHLSSRLWLEDSTRSEVDNSDIPKSRNPFTRAWRKFKARPGTYLIIPCVAAAVGWITNWMAVQMIFYPIKFRGIPLYVKEEVPLGLLGWQGIVPCKTRPMSEVMVTMVTNQLLSVKEVFQRISPFRVARLLSPRVPMMVQEVLADLPLPQLAQQAPEAVFRGLPPETQKLLHGYNRKFLQDMVKALQKNIDNIFDIQKCVQTQMLADRTLLGKLFQKCGSAELDFLTNSGLWFGFILGIIQMLVALFWENPWSLSIGGAIVGYATNWLALKWIFEPVNPTRFGPFVLQGQFLRRQKEVSKEFSHFFATKILNAEELWKSILQEPSFVALFSQHFSKLFHTVSHGLLRYKPEPETVRFCTRKALGKLPLHVPVLYKYMDNALDLEDSLRVKMEQMTSEQFERVLHPIFEEDELTLILAGAFLGLAAGLVQQGLETGKIKFPPLWKHFRSLLQRVKGFCRNQISSRFSHQSDIDNPDETPDL